MTRDDIIRMAREANILEPVDLLESNQWRQDTIRELEHFATLVATAEREAIADELEHGFVDGKGFHVLYANAIRESGNK